MPTTVIDPVLGTGSPAPLGSAALSQQKILKMVAYNPTGATVAIKVFIVPSGQSADDLHCYVDYDLEDRETYLCPEVVGYVINTGGDIEVQGTGVSFSAITNNVT